jgi:low temperature requirement protein LtrA
MHVPDDQGLLRARNGGEQQVTPLELFFDLVYVFAVTQLSHRLLEHLTIRGALETLMLLLVVWGVWVYTTWFTNWFDPHRLAVRLVLVAVMLASLIMSVAIPQAFGERGLIFALAYVAIQVGRTAFTFIALRKTLGNSHPLSRNFQRVLPGLWRPGCCGSSAACWRARRATRYGCSPWLWTTAARWSDSTYRV